MFKVDVYIATAGGVKAKDGRYGFVTEYITPNGHTSTRQGFEKEADTTSQKMTLKALVNALRVLNKPCEITLHIPDPYVRGAVESGKYRMWDDHIKNADLWQQVKELAENHSLEVAPDGSNHAYKEWMKGEMK